MFIAKNVIFYPGYIQGDGQELSDEIILPSHYLNQLINEFDDNDMLLVDIKNCDKDLSYLVAISTPHQDDKNTIFVPQWILDLIAYEDNYKDIVKISKANVKDIPIATKITIRPLDPIAFDTDILSCFEKAFMNLHSIKEGIIIPVLLSDFGVTIFAQIDKVEPAPISRIVNCEVNVEFINDFTDNISPKYEESDKSSSQITEDTGIYWGIEPVETKKINYSSLPELSAEERRQQVRDSWLKRFDKQKSQ
jgi:hypothetical protein